MTQSEHHSHPSIGQYWKIAALLAMFYAFNPAAIVNTAMRARDRRAAIRGRRTR